MRRTIQSILLALFLFACGAHEGETTTLEDELGTLEEPIWSNAGGQYVLGTCNNRTRDKCAMSKTCPTNVACVVPATKHLNFAFVGTDSSNDEFTSWKFEFRRIMGELSWFTDGAWTATETTTAQANLVITRGTCSCFSPNCDTMADLACFQEPSGVGMVTLTESLPGTYLRPASAAQKRNVTVDIGRVLSLTQFEGLYGLHFTLEHLSRWVTGTIIGVGSDTGHAGWYAMDSWPRDNAMYTDLDTGHVISVHRFNAENQYEDWEKCLLVNYSLANMGAYQVAPVGCQ